MINSVLSEHQLHNNNYDNRQAIAGIQAQCAEYAAIFDIMGKISSYSNKRDVIEKIKEIFVMIFGAQQFNYYTNDDQTDTLPKDIQDLLLDKDQEFRLSKENNKFCIKITWHEKLFGVVDVSGFMFPAYIEKYLNFALEITKMDSVDLILYRINGQIESHNSSQREDYLKISFSIGFALGKKSKDTVETIMHLADEQMYKDKSGKKNQNCVRNQKPPVDKLSTGGFCLEEIN